MSRARAGFYQHYKGGLYNVLVVDAIHSETHELMVVYGAIPRDGSPTSQLWVRPAAMFFGLNEGGVLRFRPVTNQYVTDLMNGRV